MMQRSTHQRKVLVVDDDPAILFLCGRFLASSPFTVAVANNVCEARQILARDQFDLLITDYNMPGLTGFDLVFGLRSQENPIPVILISETPSAHHVFRIAGITQWDFLEKPFRLERFLTAVRKWISGELSGGL